MSAHSALVRTDQLKEGMVLSDDLKHTNGRLILAKNTVINAKNIRIIKMWGLTEARIVTPDPPPADREALLEQAVRPIEPFIREHHKFADLFHPVNHELFRLSLEYYAFTGDRTLPAANFYAPPQRRRRPDHLTPLTAFESMDQVMESVKLPSLPVIIDRLNEAVNHPAGTSTHIADIISKDANLTIQLLKLVNSPFYAFPDKINSIARAVTIVGSRQLSLMAMGTKAVESFRDIPQDFISMAPFWKHSIAVGIIARILAGYKNHRDTENYFLAGLLHDVGRLVIYRNFPHHAVEIISRAVTEQHVLRRMEREILGIDHAALGGRLIKKWRLSHLFEAAAGHHHHPMDSKDPAFASIIHMADIIATALYFGHSGERYISMLEQPAWDLIDLPVSVLAPTVLQTSRLLDETVNCYLPRQA